MAKFEYKEPKLFAMVRHNDVSGVSGTGRVLDGVVFPNGKVVVCWRHTISSMGTYDSFEIFKTIHIDSHPTNNTEIVWLTEPPFEDLVVEENPKRMV